MTKTTSPLLYLDDSLVAGPKEIFLADRFQQSAALHHVVRIVMDSCEHERATLLVESFMQMVDRFDACRIDQ